MLLRFNKRPVEVSVSFLFSFPLIPCTMARLCSPLVVPVKAAAALDVRPVEGGGRRAVEDAAGLLKVLLRERLAAVPDRLGMEGQMVFD